MKDQMQGFSGFPAGKLATTPVPNQFFSELLPLVDNLAELKVILHLFWLIGRKSGHAALRPAGRAPAGSQAAGWAGDGSPGDGVDERRGGAA